MNDQFVRIIEQFFSVNIVLRDNGFHVHGEPEESALAQQAIGVLCRMLYNGQSIDAGLVRYVCVLVKRGMADQAETLLQNVVAFTHKGQRIRCKTLGQSAYVDSIRAHPLTIAYGPAGTGKTFLAIAMAVVALRNKDVERIILTRPAVEAGEKLGFLPGDMAQKVDPYLRPLYDALFDLLGQDTYTSLIEKGVIEIAPLAFMRGRTLNDAFIILDEAQNTTKEQMKMFLTRMGKNAKAVVTGDLTQVDLPLNKQSGLSQATKVLQQVEGISIIELTALDVVRNELVQRIVQAYEHQENNHDQHSPERV